MEDDLRDALNKNSFTLHYQPQIDLATGRMVGVEALLRLAASGWWPDHAGKLHARRRALGHDPQDRSMGPARGLFAGEDSGGMPGC